MLRIALVALAVACGSNQPPSQVEAPVAGLVTEPLVPGAPKVEQPGAAATPIADQYREVAARILEAGEKDEEGWKKLVHLTDRVGHRLSGSKALEQAIAWSIVAMKADGHDNVRAEKVMIPHWVRGEEWARLEAPVARPLAIIGLGGTVATPARGLAAQVVVARSFEELATLDVKGKIVLFNSPMRTWKNQEEGPGYGEAVAFRGKGPSAAAKLGAVAVLVRSVTARSLRSPHTGATRYEEGVKQIPAAAVSVEDAELISRLAAAGDKVTVRLRLSGKMLKDVASANAIAEITGSEKPEEIVLIGGHIDSWDVGQGAHDDAGGCVIVMQALTLLRQLGLKPRRTIRVVLFTNEENGLRGALQYAADHAAEVKNHVAALEADTGVFAPKGFGIMGDADAERRAVDIATLLAPFDATGIVPGHAGADVGPLVKLGVPGLGLSMDTSTYFDYHHSHGDTLDKIRPEDLRRDIATVALMAFVLADMPDRLGKAPPPKPDDD